MFTCARSKRKEQKKEQTNQTADSLVTDPKDLSKHVRNKFLFLHRETVLAGRRKNSCRSIQRVLAASRTSLYTFDIPFGRGFLQITI